MFTCPSSICYALNDFEKGHNVFAQSRVFKEIKNLSKALDKNGKFQIQESAVIFDDYDLDKIKNLEEVRLFIYSTFNEPIRRTYAFTLFFTFQDRKYYLTFIEVNNSSDRYDITKNFMLNRIYKTPIDFVELVLDNEDSVFNFGLYTNIPKAKNNLNYEQVDDVLMLTDAISYNDKKSLIEYYIDVLEKNHVITKDLKAEDYFKICKIIDSVSSVLFHYPNYTIRIKKQTILKLINEVV